MGPKRDNKKFNPFPGLRPFAPEESDLFFGREGESEAVLGKLLKNRFITVIGASGSGKSSLIYCGVLPRVRELTNKESSVWRIISFRPGNDPFGNLADAISDNIASNGQKAIDRDAILTELHENTDGIAAIVRKFIAQSGEKVLLVIDQFEELFRYNDLVKSDKSLVPASKFVEFMVDAVSQSVVNVFTIVTMRSDFIGECAHYQGLTQLINNSNYLVPHMGGENYRAAIEGPVKYAGASMDKELVETLVSDIGERTDQLPVLQHAMMRTWSHWQELDEPDRPITKTDYDAVGTMSNAMSLHANEAYEELSSRGKEICEMMFKTITEKGSDNKGLRHPSGVSTIKSIAGCTSEELFEVIEKFRIPSRSFITPRQNVPLDEDSVIDLSHESLMRLWDRLSNWVDEEAASVQMYLRLSEASEMYQQGKTSLWRPPDLQLAINWRNQQKPTLTWAEQYNPAFERAMVYLRTSEKEYLQEEENKIRLQKRQMKRTRIIAMILGIAAIISMGFMLFAFIQKIAADRQTILAEERRIEADRQKSIADSTAVEEAKQRALAVSNATLADLRADTARNATLARENEILANIQKDSATAAKELAMSNEQRAIQNARETLRQRMLSISKAMSVKSLQATGQNGLQTLLAYQAYLFNKRNGGPENDADIFAGLYNVAIQHNNTSYRSLKGHNGDIRSIAFAPGGKEVYTSASDGKVHKWALGDREQSLQVVYSNGDIIEALAVSPDSSWLACGSENSTIRMIPLKDNSVGYELNGHSGKIKTLIFSYDGNYLYSASLDGKVLKWDLAARTSTNISDGSTHITSIDISSNGNYLAGISSDGNVIVWDPEDNSDSFRLETSGRNIKVIRFYPGKNMLAIGDEKGFVELWDINLREKINGVQAHSAQVNDIRFNTSLHQMATASTDKTLKIFNINDPEDLTEPPITFDDNDGFVLVMQFSPDGRLLISGTYEGEQNLVARPTHVDYLVSDICSVIPRNMTQDEWNVYVGRDITFEETCQNKSYNIKVDAIK